MTNNGTQQQTHQPTELEKIMSYTAEVMLAKIERSKNAKTDCVRQVWLESAYFLAASIIANEI